MPAEFGFQPGEELAVKQQLTGNAVPPERCLPPPKGPDDDNPARFEVLHRKSEQRPAFSGTLRARHSFSRGARIGAVHSAWLARRL